MTLGHPATTGLTLGQPATTRFAVRGAATGGLLTLRPGAGLAAIDAAAAGDLWSPRRLLAAARRGRRWNAAARRLLTVAGHGRLALRTTVS